MHRIASVLAAKGTAVHSIKATASLEFAISRMLLFGVGSLLVVKDRRAIGILSERDILVRVAAACWDPERIEVGDVMTAELVTVEREASIDEAMELMSETRRRHLPVTSRDGQICGLVSIGDITKWLVKDREAHIIDLVQYITQ